MIFLLLLLLIPSYVDISFKMDEFEKKTAVTFRYLFIRLRLAPGKGHKEGKKNRKKQKDVSAGAGEKKKKFSAKDTWEKTKNGYGLFKEVKSDVSGILLYAKKHLVKIDLIGLDIVFDRDDPMDTGIMTGALNGGIYNILALLDNSIGVLEKNIKITPLFQNKDYISADTRCIVRIKNVHIIVILIKLIPVLIKIKRSVKNNKEDNKDEERKDRHGKSDRGNDEHGND